MANIYFFEQNKKIIIRPSSYVHMIYYFKAIQTPSFYNKNAYEISKRNLIIFLTSEGLVTKTKMKATKKTIEIGSQILARVATSGWEAAKDFGHIHIFGTCLKN